MDLLDLLLQSLLLKKQKLIKDDMPVAIEGYIVEHLGKDKYLFRDSTGDITIEILIK